MTSRHRRSGSDPPKMAECETGRSNERDRRQIVGETATVEAAGDPAARCGAIDPDESKTLILLFL